MATTFSMGRDINGYNAFAPIFCTNSYQVELATGAEQHFTVPNVPNMGGQNGNENKWMALFSIEPGASVWIANNTMATVPGGSIAGTVSQLNPAVRMVNGGDVLSFITNDTTAEVGVSLYVI